MEQQTKNWVSIGVTAAVVLGMIGTYAMIQSHADEAEEARAELTDEAAQSEDGKTVDNEVIIPDGKGGVKADAE